MTGSERLNRRKITLRRTIVTRYLWMFLAVAATVVGASALEESQSVFATIEAVATADSVLYRASWTDLSAIEPIPTLSVEIESQFGTTSIPLTESNREGVFSALRMGTLYRIRVVREDAFGAVVLASTSVRTLAKASGATAVTFLPMEDHPNEVSLRPMIQVLFSDPLAQYTAWRIRYQVFWQPVLEEEIINPDGYLIEPISVSGEIVEMFSLYPMNQMISIYLEAQTAQGEWHTIEHRLVATPLSFSTSLYLTSYFPDAVGYYAYASDPLDIGAVFWTELWRNGLRIDKQDILPTGDDSESTMAWFTGLTRETNYSIRLMVGYIDPKTGLNIQRVLSEQVFQTPLMYRVQASATIEGTQIILTLHLNDPNGLLTQIEYAVINHDHYEYFGGPIDLIDHGNGTKSAVVVMEFTQPGAKLVSITALLQLNATDSVTSSLFHDFVE